MAVGHKLEACGHAVRSADARPGLDGDPGGGVRHALGQKDGLAVLAVIDLDHQLAGARCEIARLGGDDPVRGDLG